MVMDKNFDERGRWNSQGSRLRGCFFFGAGSCTAGCSCTGRFWVLQAAAGSRRKREHWKPERVVGGDDGERAGVMTFQWKVSSEPGGDFLTFSVDGVEQPGCISGEAGWQTLAFTIPTCRNQPASKPTARTRFFA